MKWMQRCTVAIPAFGTVWFLAACDGPIETACPVPEDAATAAWADASRRDAGADPPDAEVAGDADVVRDAAEPAPPDAARDAGPPPACIGSYAEGVAVFAAESLLTLRAHADPEERGEITAWPWRMSLDQVRPVAVSVDWRWEGDAAAFRTEAVEDPRGRRLRLTALSDVFDRGGHAEPLLSVRACVRNDCPSHAADGSPCSCAEEVCSPVVLVAAVPVLAGRWEIAGDGLDAGSVELVQDGHELAGMPFGFPLRIEGVGVRGGDLGEYVDGAIGADRRSMTGLRTNEDGDVLGLWSARRVE